MMTNMALSLQCCVPRIQAGGLERGVGSGESGRHRGWREKDGGMGMKVGEGG